MKRMRLTIAALALSGLAPACMEREPTSTGGDEEVAAFALDIASPEPEEEGACQTVTSTFNVNVPRVLISGDFTVNGATPLPYDFQRGNIELRHETLGVVDLDSVHYGSYSRWVVPGVYDVYYRHVEGDVLPQNAETLLFDDVDLTSTGTFDIDIPSVLVMGDILLDGAPAPGGFYEWGEVRLRDTTTGATFRVGASYEGAFMAMVIPGDYDVVYSRQLGGTQVPANTEAVLVEGVTVAGVTEIDVDIPVVMRTGELRINSALAPASVYENGQIYLRDTETGDVFTLGQTRDQTYERLIVPGTYDIIYSNLLGTTQVPRNEFAVVAHDIDLTSDGDLDIDIQMVTLQGDFSLDGGNFPGGAYDRARFWLQGAEPSDVFSLGTTEAGSYERLVVPGTYDVVYEVLISNGLVPENQWAVVSTGSSVHKLKFNPPVTLDIAVSSGSLAADVTLWGETPLQGVYDNGLLLAVDEEGDMVELGTTNDAGGSVRLLSGQYGIHYSHLIGDDVPANGNARTGEGTASPFFLPIAIDLHQGGLGGDFRQGGLAFPANPSDRGAVGLRDVVTGDLVELGDTDNGSYSLELLEGTYEVVYDQVTGDAVVGNRNAVLGCVTFAPDEPSPTRPGLGGPGGLRSP